MFSLVLNILLWIAAAWLLYPLVFIRFDLGDIQTSFFRSISGVALLIIMFGKNMVDIIFLKMVLVLNGVINGLMKSVSLKVLL